MTAARDTNDEEPVPRWPERSPPRAWLETLLIFGLFCIYAIEPTPAVNEAHYLGKARHYWEPGWAAGDMFLESADAHLVFYWTFGWITRLVSLPTAAWIGRLATWALLAWAWQRLSWAVVPRRWMSLLAAGLFVTLLHWCHMAGEWVLGGVEAKGFAYVLLFLGVESLVRNRWKAVWPLLGAAASFHVLTGGWGVIAAGVAWLLQRERPGLKAMAPWLILGLVLSLPGLLPALALTRSVPAEIVREANQIYVFERLSHHLVFHRLPWNFIGRHAALIAVWCGLAWWLRGDERQRRLSGFVAGAIAIAVCGAMLDQLLLERPHLAASLLRFYWFRLSDAMVPAGAGLALAAGIGRTWGESHTVALARDLRPVAARLAMAIAGLAIVWTLLGVVSHRLGEPRGGADAQSLPTFRRHPEWTQKVYDDWRAVGRWIDEHTPADALFLTPRAQQTFKWYAGRGEVVNWKDVPQDAAGIVEWNARMKRVFPRETQPRAWTAMSDEQLIALGREYGADYLVLDRTRHPPRPGLARLYPVEPDPEAIYHVYLLEARVNQIGS